LANPDKTPLEERMEGAILGHHDLWAYIDRLEAEVVRLRQKCDGLAGQIVLLKDWGEAAEAEVVRLREALRFYAQAMAERLQGRHSVASPDKTPLDLADETLAKGLNLMAGEYAWAAYHLAKEVVQLRERLENRTALKLGFCDVNGKLTEAGWAHFREQTAGTGMVLLTAEEAARLK
jgi:hypothetical protein